MKRGNRTMVGFCQHILCVGLSQTNKYMKKQKLTSLKNHFLTGLIGCLTLVACQKSEKIDDTYLSEKIDDRYPLEMIGDWKLSDLTIINEGDSRPARFPGMPKVNDLHFILSAGGKLSSANKETGSWSVAKDHLQIRFDGDELLDMRIAQLDHRSMLLEQEFNSRGGKKEGTLYLALVK